VIPEPPDPYIGTILGERYRIIQKLGAGGMGAVYLAEHVVIERKVAIKILSQDFATKADLVQRFIQEARAAAKIGHENIVEVYDFGETASGSVFFAMEYLEGRDLASLIQQASALDAKRVRPIVLQICRALSAAHTKQIIHRDLKPENIYLIEREGRADFVKILDFGIAKITNVEEGGGRLTRAGMIFGTPEYMSPEQARGEVPDHRVDIYALGCILYEMLTGKVPFQADSFMGTLTKHMFEMPEPPSRRARWPIPQDLELICMRAIEKDRDRRFQSMLEFAQALEGEIQLQPLQPMPQMLSEPSMSPRPSPLANAPMPPASMSMGPGMPGHQQMQQMLQMQQMQQMQMQQMQMQQMQQMQGMVMQPNMYNSSGQVQMAMPQSQSGMVGGQAPQAGMSGIFIGNGQTGPTGPLITGMNVPAVAGYSTTAPPTSYEVSRQPNPAQWRRMVFILVGATIGVVVLSFLLFWPAGQGENQTRPAQTNTPSVSPPKSKPGIAAASGRPSTAPAKLTVKGVPESRVFLDFKDVGYVPASGELALDAPCPGTAEWSVHVKVVKDGYPEYSTRLMLQAGAPMSVVAEQPGGAKRHNKH